MGNQGFVKSKKDKNKNKDNLLMQSTYFCCPCFRLKNKNNKCDEIAMTNVVISEIHANNLFRQNKIEEEEYERKSMELFLETNDYSYAYNKAVECGIDKNYFGLEFFANLAMTNNENKFESLSLILNTFAKNEDYDIIDKYSDITFECPIINAMVNFNFFILYEKNNKNQKFINCLIKCADLNLLISKYYLCHVYSKYLLPDKYIEYLKSSININNNLLLSNKYLLNFNNKELIDENIIPFKSVELLANHFKNNNIDDELIEICEIGIDMESELCDNILNDFFYNNHDKLKKYTNLHYLNNENFNIRDNICEYEYVDVDIEENNNTKIISNIDVINNNNNNDNNLSNVSNTLK
jgi:hypothetical protein